MTGQETEDGLTDADRELGEHLNERRPVPSAGFRGSLGRRLEADDPGYGPRPERLELMVAGCCGGGLLLIALAALGGAGVL